MRSRSKVEDRRKNMAKQTTDESRKSTEKKPTQEAFVPQPELGESDDANALTRDKQKDGKTGTSPDKQPGKRDG
jgi:hypothetical protein